MNRRDAIAALVSLPEVTRVSVAKPEPNDVIVVECDEHLSQEAVVRIQQELGRIWPGRQIAVFEKGLRIKFAAEVIG